MKVVALNSSPNMEKGGTARILAPFLEGLEQAGAEVELFYVPKLDVKPCLGCLQCWLNASGRCVQDDDMQMLLPKLAASDVIVFATPVYADGMTGTMKTLVDRCVPMLEPLFEIREGHCRHPLRKTVRPGKVALVSVSGLPELDNFDPLVCHVKAISKNLGREFAGALLRPYAASLPALEQRGVEVAGVYEAARNAGRELGQGRAISSETLEAVSRELVRRELYVRAANAHFRGASKPAATQQLPAVHGRGAGRRAQCVTPPESEMSE